jgi:hypothetical protein
VEEGTLRRFIILSVFAFLFISSAFVFAEGRNSFAIAAGGAWPENIDPTWYVTASYRWHLEDNYTIEPDFGYWKQDQAETLHLGSGDLIYSLRDIHAGGNFLFMGTWGDVGMYGGGGAAAHWRKREIFQNVNPPKNNPDLEETRLGLQIVFGLDFPISESLDLTAAIRDDFIFRGDLDTQTVFKAYAGLRFLFE